MAYIMEKRHDDISITEINKMLMDEDDKKIKGILIFLATLIGKLNMITQAVEDFENREAAIDKRRIEEDRLLTKGQMLYKFLIWILLIINVIILPYANRKIDMLDKISYQHEILISQVEDIKSKLKD